jgi:hypothetical protein
MKSSLAWLWHFPGCAYSIAIGAKEADDGASRLLLSAGLVSPKEVPR